MTTCNQHGPYEEKTSTVMGRTLVMPCPECAKAALKNVHQVAQVKPDAIQGKKEGLPARWADLHFSAMKEDSSKAVAEVLTSYLVAYPKSARSCSFLVLLGEQNVSKLACAFINQASQKGIDSCYSMAQSYLMAMRSTFNASSKETEDQVLNRYVDKELLIIDGLWLTRNSEDDRFLLSTLLYQRFMAVKPTLLVSKGDTYALSGRLGSETFDMILENGKILTSK